jgi:hypothetical protein
LLGGSLLLLSVKNFKTKTMEKLNDYMLLFRFEPNANYQPTETELAEQKKAWGAFIGGIAAQAKLVSTHQLGFNGKQVSADISITDGIHLTNKVTLGGNMIVKSYNLDEAVEIAKACPILKMGGSVEVRNILAM